MGYTTEFTGILKFKKEPSASELAYLSKFLGEDIREHSEWLNPDKAHYYIQYAIADDYTGIEWDGGEKFYDAEGCVNLIIANMQIKYPDFGFDGELLAQGEDYDDRWILRMVNNKAVRVDQPRIGSKITCPHCSKNFILEGE